MQPGNDSNGPGVVLFPQYDVNILGNLKRDRAKSSYHLSIQKTFPMPHAIKVGLADDYTLFRKTLADYISQQPGITVTLQATSAQDLCTQLKTTPVDLIVMDLFLPEPNLTDTLQFIRTNFADIKIIILSDCADLDLISTLLDVGIHAYISKADEPENLLHAIQALHENKIYRNKFFTEALYWNKQQATALIDTVRKKVVLDDRERKVIQLLWEEKSNKEIADVIFLSVRSVEKIRQDLKEKTGAKTVAGIFKYALRYKLIGFDEGAGKIYFGERVAAAT